VSRGKIAIYMAIKRSGGRYSIAEARDALPAIVREVEERGKAEVTRRGRAVAVLLSIAEYEKLGGARTCDFWRAYQQFRRRSRLSAADAEEFVRSVNAARSRAPGRSQRW
jgi:prevent-host-death family protein